MVFLLLKITLHILQPIVNNAKTIWLFGHEILYILSVASKGYL